MYVKLLSKYLSRTLVVCDEIHTVNDNEKKTMFKPLFQTLSLAHKMVIMSATPIKNTKKDLIPYMKLLRIKVPSREEDYENAFRGKVSVYDPPPRQGPYVSGQRHFPNLNVSNKNLVVKMTNANRNKILSQPINSYAKMRAVERNVFGNRNPKFEAFHGIYSHRPGRTIVYFEEKRSVDDFVDFVKLTMPNVNIQKLVGGMSETIKKRLVKNEGVDVYAITSAGKVGLDFKGIRTIIFMEYPWTASDYWQIVGRGVRTGSHNNPVYTNKSVKVYNLMYRAPVGKSTKFKNEVQLNRIHLKQNLGNQVKSKLSQVNIGKIKLANNTPVRNRNNVPVARKINNTTYNIGDGRVYSIRKGKTSVMKGSVPYTPQNWTKRTGIPIVRRRPVVVASIKSKRNPISIKPESVTRINVLTRKLGVS